MRPGDRDKLGRRFNIKPKTCRVCGEEFQPTNGMQIYCSPACARESEMIEGECERCGRTFRKRRQGGTQPRFCGVKCSSQATAAARAAVLRGPQQLRLCESCGETIQRKNRRFCSAACAAKARRRGRKTGWSPGGWGLAKKGEKTCRNCGRPAEHLHHIVPRSLSRNGRGNVGGNGLPLCFWCHRGWHDRTVTIFRDRLAPEEVAFAIETMSEWWLDKNYPRTPDDDLRRLHAARRGEDPDETAWRYCREGQDGDRGAVERAGSRLMAEWAEREHDHRDAEAGGRE